MPRSYLGQCQLLSIQEFLCRDQVFCSQFVSAVLCNIKQNFQSYRCHWAHCLPSGDTHGQEGTVMHPQGEATWSRMGFRAEIPVVSLGN